MYPQSYHLDAGKRGRRTFPHFGGADRDLVDGTGPLGNVQIEGICIPIHWSLRSLRINSFADGHATRLCNLRSTHLTIPDTGPSLLQRWPRRATTGLG